MISSSQVGEEFRQRLPRVMKGHALRTIWGYKYNSTGEGIGTHADDFAVNINIWVTTDAANLDKERGGIHLCILADIPCLATHSLALYVCLFVCSQHPVSLNPASVSLRFSGVLCTGPPALVVR